MATDSRSRKAIMDITAIVRMDRPRRPCRFFLLIEIDSTEASGLEHLIRNNQARVAGKRSSLGLGLHLGGNPMKRTWTIIGVGDVPGSLNWYQALFGQHHSSRSRIIGSTARARRAGTKAATTPTQSIVRMTPPRMTGSLGVA
jgi:hypothetical protein